jgi:hypothetical protein
MTPLPHLEAARVRRELAHLQALAARNRIRAASARLTRGALGFLGGFAARAAVPAAPLAAKLFLAALLGLALAWPFAALVVLSIGLFLLSLFSNSSTQNGDLTDCCACCDWRNKRRERLETLISEREAWLESRSGAPPIVPRRDGPAKAWRL